MEQTPLECQHADTKLSHNVAEAADVITVGMRQERAVDPVGAVQGRNLMAVEDRRESPLGHLLATQYLAKVAHDGRRPRIGAAELAVRAPAAVPRELVEVDSTSRQPFVRTVNVGAALSLFVGAVGDGRSCSA